MSTLSMQSKSTGWTVAIVPAHSSVLPADGSSSRELQPLGDDQIPVIVSEPTITIHTDSTVANATHYKLLEYSDGVFGFTLAGVDVVRFRIHIRLVCGIFVLSDYPA